jgi:uncharacterized protein with GYD domain
MPKYMISATYSEDGMKGLLKEGGTARRDAFAKLCAELGGEMEACYYTFGTGDGYVIVDLPDSLTMAALSLAVNASGGGRVSSTELVTPEELDAAMKMSIAYRPPTP